MTMADKSPINSEIPGIIQSLDTVVSHPDLAEGMDEKLAATRNSIISVFQDCRDKKNISPEKMTLVDGFLFLFNDPVFSSWHTLNWWEQRQIVLGLKDNLQYLDRANELLAESCMAPYISYSDDQVARSTDQEVKQAWMRKRLVQKEAFWNFIDSVSCAAYFQKKYQASFPALCLLLCRIADETGREKEMFLGIDNGIGYVYKKKSRESALIRFLYMVYKFFFKKGVFYIGGLELGLLETDSELSCHGSGAVVYQGWHK